MIPMSDGAEGPNPNFTFDRTVNGSVMRTAAGTCAR